MDPAFYGRRLYCYIDGKRHQSGLVRHERVHPGETAAAFSERIEQIVQQHCAPDATIKLEEEIVAGCLVGCLITWSHPPALVALISLPEPESGGRQPGQRGRRGSGRH